MIPLWKLRSGQFAGWRTADGELYNAAGKHIGYFGNEDIAYTNDGHAVGEVYGERYMGKRETLIYPTGRQQGELSSKAPAPLADRPELRLASWTDPEL